MPRPDDSTLLEAFREKHLEAHLEVSVRDAGSERKMGEAERFNFVMARIRGELEQEFGFRFADAEFLELMNDPRWREGAAQPKQPPSSVASRANDATLRAAFQELYQAAARRFVIVEETSPVKLSKRDRDQYVRSMIRAGLEEKFGYQYSDAEFQMLLIAFKPGDLELAPEADERVKFRESGKRPVHAALMNAFRRHFIEATVETAAVNSKSPTKMGKRDFFNQCVELVRRRLEEEFDFRFSDAEYLALIKGCVGRLAAKMEAEGDPIDEVYRNIFIGIAVVVFLVCMFYFAWRDNTWREERKARLNDPTKIPMFVQDIRGDDETKRDDAVYAFELFRERASGAAPEVAKALTDERPQVRKAAVRALGAISQNPDIRRQMRKMQTDDPSAEVRATLDDVLGN